MMVLGMKTIHIIDGGGAEHPGMVFICEDVDDFKNGRLKPISMRDDKAHAV
jgi:hypothetical protein